MINRNTVEDYSQSFEEIDKHCDNTISNISKLVDKINKLNKRCNKNVGRTTDREVE